MNLTIRPAAVAQPPDRHVVRAKSGVLAVALAAALWAIATQLLGVEVRSPEMGGEPAAEIPFLHVVAASLVASIAAWGLLTVLERFTRRARTVWLTISVVVLALSLGAPLTGAGLTAANRAVLTLLHVVVGAALIAGLARTASAGPDSSNTTDEADREEVFR